MPIHKNTKRADPTKAGKGQTVAHVNKVNSVLRRENHELIARNTKLEAENAALRRQIAEGEEDE